MDGLVAKRGPVGLGEQVHEHIIRVQLAVLLEDVGAVEADQAGGDGDGGGLDGFGPGAVGVVVPGHDPKLLAVGDEVAMAKSQGLADAKPCLDQKHKQEAVPEVGAGLDYGQYLVGGKRAGQPAGLAKAEGPGGHRASSAHVVEEGLVATPVGPPPGHQVLGQSDAVAGVVVVEGEQGGQVAVDRGRRPSGAASLQDHHVVGRGPEPGHEPGHQLGLRLVPGFLHQAQELEPELEAGGVGPSRGGRAVQGLKVGEECLDRGHHLPAIVEDRPGLGPPWHHHLLDAHGESALLDGQGRPPPGVVVVAAAGCGSSGGEPDGDLRPAVALVSGVGHRFGQPIRPQQHSRSSGRFSVPSQVWGRQQDGLSMP